MNPLDSNNVNEATQQNSARVLEVCVDHQTRKLYRLLTLCHKDIAQVIDKLSNHYQLFDIHT